MARGQRREVIESSSSPSEIFSDLTEDENRTSRGSNELSDESETSSSLGEIPYKQYGPEFRHLRDIKEKNTALKSQRRATTTKTKKMHKARASGDGKEKDIAESPTASRRQRDPSVDEIQTKKPRKTIEDQFRQVEEAMATGISSRTVTNRDAPMIRRGGRLSLGRPRHLPRAGPIPRQQREVPSPAVQSDRVTAFRGQIEAASAFVGTRAEAIFHLRRYNWDVDSAVTEWLRHHQRRLREIDADDFELEPVSGDEDIEHRRIQPRRTGEQERRDTTSLLIQRIREALDDDSIALTRYEAIGLLHHYRFDIDQAVERYVNSDGNLEEIAEIYEPLRRRRPNQRQQDRRVAEYVDITGVGDWYTAWELLKNLDWDLAKALSMWQQNRVRPVRHPDREIKGWGKKQRERERRGFRLDCEGNLWTQDEEPAPSPKKSPAGKSGKGKEKALFAEESEVESSSGPTDDEREYENQRQEGAPIGPRVLAKVGAPNPDLFSVEFIRDGEYRRDRWNGGFRLTTPPRMKTETSTYSDEDQEPKPKGKGKAPLPVEEVPSPAGDRGQRPPQIIGRKKGRGGSTKGRRLPRSVTDFDWNNPVHIRQLNQWTNQRHSRMTQEKEADRLEWLPAEQDFLRQLHHDLKEERLRKNPQHFDKSKKMYLPEAVKNDWVRRFNERFQGTLVEGSSEPRPHRSWGAISSQRSRLRDLCDAFDIKFSEPHPVTQKRPPGIKTKPVDEPKGKRESRKGGPRGPRGGRAGRVGTTERVPKRKRDDADGSDDDHSPTEDRGMRSDDEPGPGPSKHSKRA